MPTVPFSCDSHVVEAPEVYRGLEERFGSRALASLFKDVPADGVDRMVSHNVRRLYGLAV